MKNARIFAASMAGSSSVESRSAARVAAKQRASPAPSAAAREPAAGFDDEVAAVANELGIRAECAAQRAFDLLGRVVIPAELARGRGDQRAQRREIRERGAPQPDAPRRLMR